MHMPKTELLLLRGGIAPVRGRKIAFYRMPRFTRRVLSPPILPSRPIPAATSPTVLPPGKHRVVSPYNDAEGRSEEHTSELQSLMRISYAVFCLKKKNYSIQM